MSFSIGENVLFPGCFFCASPANWLLSLFSFPLIVSLICSFAYMDSMSYKKGLLMNNPPSDPNDSYSQSKTPEQYPQFSQETLLQFPTSPGYHSQNVPKFPQTSGQYIENLYFGQFNQPPPPQLPAMELRQSLQLDHPHTQSKTRRKLAGYHNRLTKFMRFVSHTGKKLAR